MYPIKIRDQKSVTVWDVFRGQQSQVKTDVLNNYNLVTITVPNNLTHLLQSLDLTINDSFKNMEKAATEITFQTQSRRSSKSTLKMM